MKIAIVDDEEIWRNKTKDILEKHYCNQGIIMDVYNDGVTYLKNREKYDISFVDIEMPAMDGFDTIEGAKKYNPEGIYIILTTHTDMSRKGYLVNAFRYIDKIKMNEELKEALASADNILRRKEKIEVDIVGEGTYKIILKDIIYVEFTKPHSVLIHTKSDILRSNSSLSDIEKMLEGKWFYRCHNSYIINLDEVRRLEGNEACMRNGDKLSVAKKKIPDLKSLYIKRKYDCANA